MEEWKEFGRRVLTRSRKLLELILRFLTPKKGRSSTRGIGLLAFPRCGGAMFVTLLYKWISLIIKWLTIPRKIRSGEPLFKHLALLELCTFTIILFGKNPTGSSEDVWLVKTGSMSQRLFLFPSVPPP
jgi:hypothetical protein